MGLCTTRFPAGANIDCQKLLARAKGAAVVKASTSIPIASAQNKSAWLNKMRQDLELYYFEFSDYEPSVDEPEVQTDGYGRKRTVREFAPSVVAYAQMGMCDFRELLRNMKGDTYGVYFHLDDGNWYGWEYNGEFKPFTGELFAVQKGLAPKDAIHQFNQINMNFTSVSQFNEFKVLRPNFNIGTEMLEGMPTGYDMSQSNFTGTVITAQVDLRCDDGVAGFVAADFEITETSQSGLAISTVNDDGNGAYTITFDAAVTADNYAKVRLKKVVSSNVTDISNEIFVEV